MTLSAIDKLVGDLQDAQYRSMDTEAGLWLKREFRLATLRANLYRERIQELEGSK